MSAIYGIINKDGKPVDPEMVQKMKQAMKHRAKDGGAEWTGDNAAFGFCHLIVYPNQENEKLPLESGDLVITANAHLHNRAELIKKLGVDTKQYATTPDSYLILKAFEKWGAECVQHLDGEYVYAIWNKVSKELFISNDHIGFKALYYYDTPEQFIFCSEIKGIEAVKVTPNYFDGNSLITHFYTQGDQSATFNIEIKKLKCAEVFQWADRKASWKKYWELTPQGKYHFKNSEQWYQCIKEKLWKAVEARVITNKPTGVMLSGGLDSSTITCILSKVFRQKNLPIYTFSSVLGNAYEGEKVDESKYINAVIKHCGNLIHTNVTAPNKGPFIGVKQSFTIEEIIPDKFHYMDIAIQEAALKQNVKVLFSGFGGDFWVSAKGFGVLNILVKQGKWNLALKLLTKMASVENVSMIKALYKYYFAFTSLYEKLKALETSPVESFWNKKFINTFNIARRKGILPAIKNEINTGRVSTYLGIFDTRNQYYHMDSAVPFFDRNLMETMADVPMELFLADGHLRSVMYHLTDGVLPKEVQSRRSKSPYVVNHFERFSTSEGIISRMTSSQYDVLFDRYFDRLEVQKLLERLDLARKPKPDGYFVCFLAITAMVFEHLKEKKYIFR
jgi:asparagine synthase (glutamine-hydrolysing)